MAASKSITAALFVALGLGGAVEAREVVPALPGMSAGSLVVRTAERRLYLINWDGTAIRYAVAVGKPGKQWAGATSISGKYYQPDWSPPAVVKRDNPHLPNLIRGGTSANPMGVAAMTLSRGQYAIHGTNRPESIGRFASYGCIRMHNRDIADLIERVSVGTPVYVTH